jgi:hypothetical protein
MPNDQASTQGPLSQIGAQVAQAYEQNANFDRSVRQNIGVSNISNSALVNTGAAAILGHQNVKNDVHRRESNLFTDPFSGQRLTAMNTQSD